MSAPTFGSLFSGIGGFDLGLERAGWECAFQVEVDPFCTKVLERHWPHVRRYRDIRDVTFAHPAGEQLPVGAGSPDREPRIDLLCGGFPCQDLSVAGRRAGLAGVRSGLFFEFVRLARELRPRWLLLENVLGLLSSNGGRDFRTVLSALGDAGYGVGWRVLDSRWFGVPQRRRRVFLVGRLGAPCPYAVLFEPPGVLGHFEESGEAGEEPAHSLRSGTQGGRTSDDPDRVTFALTAPGRKGGDPSTDTYIPTAFNHLQDPVSSPSVVPTLGEEGQAVSIAAPLTGGGHPNSNAPGRRKEDDVNLAYTLSRPSRYGGEYEAGVTAIEHPTAAVRRLTPTECERLQNFPDGFTCLCGVEPYSTWDCTCPDGPRYGALGNAVTVSVITWLGARLLNAAQKEEAA